MGIDIDLRWTDDEGESPGRYHVSLNGCESFSSVPCEKEDFLKQRERLHKVLRDLAEKSYDFGQHKAKEAIRIAIGARG